MAKLHWLYSIHFLIIDMLKFNLLLKWIVSFKSSLKVNVKLNGCHSMCCSRYNLGSWWVSLAELETGTASFQGMHTSHSSLYPVCHVFAIFFTKCSGSSDLCGFFPSVKCVKADQRVQMLEEKAEIIEIQCLCPSLMSLFP